MPVSRQESERSCICVLGICILSLLDFRIDPNMWYVFIFHFTLSGDGLDVNNLESGSAESFRKPNNIMLLVRSLIYNYSLLLRSIRVFMYVKNDIHGSL